MAMIGLNITASGFSGSLIVRWVRPTAPLAEVGRSAAMPFPVDTVYVIPDLAPVVFTVQLWRSDDGVSLDQLIKDWSIDASKSSHTTVRTYQYKVGRGDGDLGVWADPNDLDTILEDTRLDGYTKDEMIVHEAGYGNKLDAEYDLVAGGGIELLGGATFNEGTPWFITVIDTEITEVAPGSGTGNMYAGVEILTANQDFDSDLYKKLCIADFAGAVGTITIPDLSLIPDDTLVTFQTHGGAQNYLTLQFDPGDSVKFQGQDVNVIHLPKGEKITLYFFDGNCYVIDYDGNASRRGCVQWEYDSNRDADSGSMLFADESTGELDGADYPGIYAFISQLSGSAVCVLGTALGQWSYDSGGGVYPNKNKFGINTGGGTFRVPHLSGLVAKSSSTPGVYEADQNRSHGHAINSTNTPASSTNTPDVVRGSATGTVASSRGIEAAYGGADDKTIKLSGGAEVRVKSFSQKPFILL